MTQNTKDAGASIPVELLGVAEVLESGDGFWRSCSGCHETEDGHDVGHYEYSEVLKCTLGGGCSECGGIGAVWDDTDYGAMADAWDAAEIAREQAAELQPPIYQVMVGDKWVDSTAAEYAAVSNEKRVVYAAPVAPTPATQEWQPIETAPKTGRTLMLGYPNAAGKWRTVRGQWMSDAYIEQNWEEPDDAEAGWYETSVEAEDTPSCWPITPTHWMPLPAAPAASAGDQA